MTPKVERCRNPPSGSQARIVRLATAPARRRAARHRSRALRPLQSLSAHRCAPAQARASSRNASRAGCARAGSQSRSTRCSRTPEASGTHVSPAGSAPRIDSDAIWTPRPSWGTRVHTLAAMSELEIIALFTPTEDHVHSVEDLLKAAVAPSRAEPGNVAYTVRRLEGTPARFAVLERWADDEAFAAHDPLLTTPTTS